MARWIASFIILALITGYTFAIERHDSFPLIAGFLFLFGAYIFGAFYDASKTKHWFIVGLTARVILLLSLPVLSDDYFRFIWDGRLLNAGINPFESLPEAFLNQQIPGIDQELFQNLNSTEYFTIYPPLNQLLFWFSVWVFPDSLIGAVTVMRVFIMAADIGNFFIIRKLASARKVSPEVAFIYFLNPLVILEFTGNLHFESVMIFFILLSVFFLERNGVIKGATAVAMAILAKLLPIMYMPALLKYLSFKKAFLYYALTGIIVILAFVPLISLEFLQGLTSSLDLYFRKFEFNASFYFIFRAIGFAITGYNEIARIGPILGILTIICIVIYLIKVDRKNTPLAEIFLMIHLFYLLFATTVHPWYITTILALSATSKYRFAVVWSGFIFLTYVGYNASGFELPNWVLFLEYSALTMALVYDFRDKIFPGKENLSAKNS
ncbi:MAG: hypothetical protein AAFQ94_16040 [Bacteroidota bacterium]